MLEGTVNFVFLAVNRLEGGEMEKMYRGGVDRLRKFKIPIYILMIFICISIGLWIWFDNVFYLFNFMYIGFLVSLGIFLLIKKYKYSRQVVQFGVGLYMLVYLGLICRENMQIEGFGTTCSWGGYFRQQ